MTLKLVSSNLTCLFDAFNKSMVKVDVLRLLIAGETPMVQMFPDPNFPLIVEYPRASLSIHAIEGRLIVTTKAKPDAKANREFGRILREALEACQQQAVGAYGFNFDYEFEGPSIVELLGLQPGVFDRDGYELQGSTIVHLSYTKEGVGYNLDVKEGKPASAHVNVHFEVRTETLTLAGGVDELLTEWKDNARRFLVEVVRDADR